MQSIDIAGQTPMEHGPKEGKYIQPCVHIVPKSRFLSWQTILTLRATLPKSAFRSNGLPKRGLGILQHIEETDDIYTATQGGGREYCCTVFTSTLEVIPLGMPTERTVTVEDPRAGSIPYVRRCSPPKACWLVSNSKTRAMIVLADEVTTFKGGIKRRRPIDKESPKAVRGAVALGAMKQQILIGTEGELREQGEERANPAAKVTEFLEDSWSEYSRDEAVVEHCTHGSGWIPVTREMDTPGVPMFPRSPGDPPKGFNPDFDFNVPEFPPIFPF